MSEQPIGEPASVLVCDLCGKPLPKLYDGNDQVRIDYSTRYPKRNWLARSFRFNGGTYGRSSFEPGRWSWDFHAACFVDAMNPLVIEEVRR